MIELVNEGWIIRGPNNKYIYDFTFSRTRSSSIRKWVIFWNKPNGWKSYYRKGCRCVRATRTIRID